MSIMDLLGAGKPRRQEYEDFVGRYEQGEPHEGYADDEVKSRYDEVSSGLDDDEYEESAQEAFGRMSPQGRRELAQLLRKEGREGGVDLGEHDRDDDERYEDPRELARMTRHVRKQKPDLLGGLLGGGGGGGGGALGNPIAKAALAGVAAMAAKRMFGR